MAEKKSTSGGTEDRELLITRTFDAPRALVFQAWTDPKHVVHWWGPRGFTNTVHEMDVRPGGIWRFTMHSPDGIDFPNKIVFEEVVKPSRLVFLYSEDMEGDPHQFSVTVTFTTKGQKTEITMRMIFRSKQDRDRAVEQYGAIEGNKQTLDRLEAYLKTM
jgi:uncharacterized protein YndB with AHSA1/START domain